MARTFAAVTTLTGTLIGAGILGIPYVVMKAGFLIGLITIIFMACLFLLLYLYLGEIGLRTRSNHHLIGYASLYLGKKGKTLMLIAFAFSIYSGLIAYLIGEGESISYLITGTANYSLHFGIAFWILLSIFSYFGLKALREGEEVGFMFVIVMIISITVFFWKKIDTANLSSYTPALFYYPFGVIMFAFLGYSALPEVERILKLEKNKTKKSIFIAMLITTVIYIVFAAVVVGSQGSSTPELATIILGKPFIILGIFTMFTAYLSLNTAFIDMMRFDLYKKKTTAWLYSIFVPLIIYLILYHYKANSFIKILGISGVISGTIVSTLILLMVKKAKFHGNRKPEYSIPYSRILAFLIILILIAGAILEIAHNF